MEAPMNVGLALRFTVLKLEFCFFLSEKFRETWCLNTPPPHPSTHTQVRVFWWAEVRVYLEKTHPGVPVGWGLASWPCCSNSHNPVLAVERRDSVLFKVNRWAGMGRMKL